MNDYRIIGRPDAPYCELGEYNWETDTFTHAHPLVFGQEYEFPEVPYSWVGGDRLRLMVSFSDGVLIRAYNGMWIPVQGCPLVYNILATRTNRIPIGPATGRGYVADPPE